MDFVLTFLLVLVHQKFNIAAHGDQSMTSSKIESGASYSTAKVTSREHTINSGSANMHHESNVHHVPTDDILKQNEALTEVELARQKQFHHTSNVHRAMDGEQNLHHIASTEDILKQNAALVEEGVNRAWNMAQKHHDDVRKQHEAVAKHQEGILASMSEQKSEADDIHHTTKNTIKRNGLTVEYVHQTRQSEHNLHDIPTAEYIFKQNAALVEEGVHHARSMAQKHQDAVRQHQEVVRQQHDAIRQQHDTVRQQHDAVRQQHDAIRQQHEDVSKHQKAKLASKSIQTSNDCVRDGTNLQQTEDVMLSSEDDTSVITSNSDDYNTHVIFGTDNKGQKYKQTKPDGNTKQTGNSYSYSSSSSSSSDGERHFTSSSMTSGPDGVKHTWHSSNDPGHVFTWTEQTPVKSRDQSTGTCSSSASATSSTNGKGSFHSSTMTSGSNGVKHTYHSSDDPDKVYVWTEDN